MKVYYSISETAEILGLYNSSSKKTSNHVLRYWEKEFKQIIPKKINNRRYYNLKQIELLKMIKYFLKDKGLSISGLKKMLNKDLNTLDGANYNSLKADYLKNVLRTKSKHLLNRIRKLKYGKKNSS